eukprot:gb/GECG01007843.1/.p1 GENE.gb/GECG01007843.1/~~gb/GECG01007843.1/.p1  ORF type:complete len:321 (+),score=42.61 gb/GECG01007843.1/:1-963(+)
MAEFQIVNTNASSIAVDKKHTLSEGLIWDHHTQTLMFVDIDQGHVFEALQDTDKKELQVQKQWSMGEKVGTVVPVEGPSADNNRAVVALESGIHFLKHDGTLEFLCDDPHRDKTFTRFNDGKCDPRGRLVVGSMDRNAKQPLGKLYVMEREAKGNYQLRCLLSDVTISNGLCWTEDGKTMYYLDTGCPRSIWAFDYDLDTPTLTNRRQVVEFPEKDPGTGEEFTGAVDGCTIDKEGFVWTAHFGGSKVTCTDPRTGKFLKILRVPTTYVTSVAFAGSQLQDLYVSTASRSESSVDADGKEGRVYVYKSAGEGANANMFRE